MNLNVENPSERCKAIEALINKELSEELTKTLCRLVEDQDKGVQNSVDFVLSNNGSPYIPVYLVRYISSRDISIRNLAGEILLKIGSGSVKAMLNYMKSANDNDIKFLVDILGLIGDVKAAPAILEILQSNKNENVILACIEALGNLKYENALDVIVALYEANELYKATICEAIGKIGSQAALDFIISNFKREDDLTKFSMIESLGIIGNEETLFFLISELAELNGPLIWPMIESICLLKEKFGLDIPFDERMKNLILNTIDDADTRYKKTAAKLIVAFESDEIMSACLKIFGEDFEIDELLKPKIIEAPGKFFELLPSFISNNPKNLFSLLTLAFELVTSESINYKSFITPIQIRELTDCCVKCLNDPVEEIRKTGAEMLFILDQDVAILFLDKILDDQSVWNKIKFLDILSGIDSSEVQKAIIKLTNDDEEIIRERANEILVPKSTIQQISGTEENI